MVVFETGGAPVNPRLVESYVELGIYVSNGSFQLHLKYIP